MNKESIIELQKVDCNCNDCGWMVRDFARFEQSVNDHREWQQNYFDSIKRKMEESRDEWLDKGEKEKAAVLDKEIKKLKFVFNKSECRINFGTCLNFNKPVQFIPNVLQLETQECFKHRKEFNITLGS